MSTKGTLRVTAQYNNTIDGLPTGAAGNDSGKGEASIALGSTAVDAALTVAVALTASGTADIDLQNLTDACGNSVALTELHAIVLRNTSTETVTVIDVDGAVTNGWTNGLNGSTKIKQGGVLALGAGDGQNIAVSGTNKVLTLTNDDATNAADLIATIIGKV